MARPFSARVIPAASPAPEDDHALVARVRAGDSSAFATLFRRYYTSLCRFVFRYVQSRAEAEDLVHDVFLRLWERHAEWEVRVDVPTYLFGAARNRALNALKHAVTEQRWREHEGTLVLGRSDMPAAEGIPNEAEARLAREEIDTAIAKALADLPVRCRTALTLRWQRQMSYAEIAEVMGIAVKTVEIYMTRGHKALRAAYVALQVHRD